MTNPDFLVPDATRHQTLWEHIIPHLDTSDLAHDLLHLERVYKWSIHLAKMEGQDTDIAGAVALLHDIVNIPKESDLRSSASELSAIFGVSFLEKSGYNSTEIATITDAIHTCSWSKGRTPNSIYGAILQDADRLDAIGAIGIMRNMACAQAMHSRGSNGAFYNNLDPIGKSDRILNDKNFAIDHFFCKLLHLQDTMHTNTAKQEAERRHQFLQTFLDELGMELATLEK